MSELTPKQCRLLKYLCEHAGWHTRDDMREKTGSKDFSKALGAPRSGIPKSDSLEGMGFVQRRDDIARFEYRITQEGKRAFKSIERQSASVEYL